MLHHSPDGAQGLFQSVLDVCFLTSAEPLRLMLQPSAFDIDDNINSPHLAGGLRLWNACANGQQSSSCKSDDDKLNVKRQS